jgi:hypothetical protein
MVLGLIVAAGMPLPAHAYETDQYTQRATHIRDSTDILNEKVNDTIEEIVAAWSEGHDELEFVDAFYRELGGLHWVDRLERWAIDSPDVDKLDVGRYESIFSGQPFWATRVAKFFGTGSTIRLNEQLIGSDKIGHFISQGRKYYKRYLESGSEAEAAEHSAFTERAIFGQMSNGIYSNADLVANYEGHRFFRSLFEDDVTPGKPSILRWESNGWIIQREFDWADHVNEYWDEALNISHFDGWLYGYMHDTFVAMCPKYWERPDLYMIANEEKLKARYAHLELRDASELRLDSLCPVQAFLDGDTSKFVTPEGKSLPDVPTSP